MRRHSALSLLVLLASLGVALGASWRDGRLAPERTNDTFSYAVLLRAETPFEALSGLRTYGYPLILKLAGFEAGEWSGLPAFHFAALALAAVLFWAAVARFTGSPWLGAAAAVPIGAGCMLAYLPHVQPDAVGAALALAAVALLLLLTVAPRRPAIWIALGAATFLAYLTKPVFVFLVALPPLLGWMLRRCHRPEERRRWRPLTLGLAALTGGPLLLFCLFRFAVVGELGMGNLVGYNLLGVSACFLDRELVAELPGGEPGWLAGRILHWRERRGWKPMRLDSRIEPYQQQHTPNIFRIAEPILARQMRREMGADWPDDPERRPLDIPGSVGRTALEFDRRFARLGWAIVARRPLLHLKWMHDNFRAALRTPLDCAWTRWLGVAVALMAPVVALRGARDPSFGGRFDRRRAAAVVALVVVGLLFFLGNLAVVLPVHWLKERYAAAAGLLLPGVLGALAFEAGRLALAPLTPDRRP